ncbi:Pseudouridine synthase [Polystyrenella longa]|uniref:Pseudouridine synthase n=1 Tax=Polystyrenella longa TaxID=2528007 RepID=A0A518CJ21_9PLAN|nr:RluA family pseudouridine synthase [Polystyrenella longa]QDU79210.1 Pseudouridine synthase [Polystyrenella longa]
MNNDNDNESEDPLEFLETPPELTSDPVDLVVESRAHGWRLDHYLTRLYPNYSRQLFNRAIRIGAVQVNGLDAKKSRRLRVNDRITVRLPEEPDSSIQPENIPLDVIYEDEHLVVINKQANMIVHPGKGNYSGTLAGALQFHFDQLSDSAGQHRPGIVHRLDRDTTGVIIIAKNNQVHDKLSKQFADRVVNKEYRALTWYELDFDADYIETHIRQSYRNRERMIVTEEAENTRFAKTFFEVLERFDGFTYVKLLPETGRTHQLRVHMQHKGCSLLADVLYKGGPEFRLSNLTDVASSGLSDIELDEVLISRQALHAFRLEITHPQSGKRMQFEAPLPEDFMKTLEALRRYRSKK